MGQLLKPEWQPSDNVAELLANRFGIRKEDAREFIGGQLPVFKLYWLDPQVQATENARKSSWDTTCYNWMCSNYEDQKELMAKHRSLTPKQGDIFENALDGVVDTVARDTGQTQPVQQQVFRRKHVIQHTPIPGDGETMSEADALNALAALRA
jgi:hypothetical protein